MGMIAEYLMIDEKTLDSLMELNSQSLTERVIDLGEQENAERISIGKIWDALHYLLTDFSASNPIEGNKLSEAIVGIHPFIIDEEEADFISCTENEELPEIIEALENIDFQKLFLTFDPKLLEKAKIYPNGIWKERKENLLKEMEIEFLKIIHFYRKSLSSNKHIIVSIL